jgi:hypothetical protein
VGRTPKGQAFKKRYCMKLKFNKGTGDSGQKIVVTSSYIGVL